jgi:uncharacterized membrane protein
MDVFAFLIVFILLIVYIRQTNKLSEKILQLEREIYSVRNSISSSTAAAPITAKAAPKTESAARSAPALFPLPRVTPPVVAAPTPLKPSRTREEWEALIGGKLLNRIGAFALILGVGFFLKYAFDNNLISAPIRVLTGFLIGAGLLLGGRRWHKKGFAIFAQGLIGAGIAILYLSVYASFNFYHLVSQPVAFVLMSAITALTFLQALKYDSLAVSLLGWAGGFLTPIMLSTGQSNEIGLFTYLALLDIGLLAIVLRKDSWVVLEPLTLAATYLTYFAWHEQHYSEKDLFLTIFFLTLFWGLFYALDILRLIRTTTTFQSLRQSVAGFNALLYYLFMYEIIDPSHHNWMSGVTLFLGAIYFLTFLVIKRRQPEAVLALAQLMLTAIILLVIATAIQFSGFVTVAFWALEALALSWCGVRWEMRHVRYAALGLIGLALVKLIFTTGAFGFLPLENFELIFNQRALAFAALAVAAALTAILFRRVHEDNSQLLQMILHGTWSVLLFVLLTVESDDYFRQRMAGATTEMESGLSFNRFMTWAAVWTFYSLPFVWLGLRHKVLSLFCSGLGSLSCAVFTIAIQGLAFAPISKFTFVLNWRAAIFILVIAGAIVHARWLNANRQSYSWLSDAIGILQVVIVLLFLDLLTSETRDLFKRAIFFAQERGGNTEGAAEINRLQNLQQLTLSGVWLFYSVLLMVAGIWRRAQGLRIMAIVLFGFTILKIFIYDLAFLERLYRIFSFIGLGVILLLVSYLYQRYKAVIFDSEK